MFCAMKLVNCATYGTVQAGII